MWSIPVIVVAAGLLMWWLGRGRAPDGVRRVDDVSAAGLHVGDITVGWESVYDVRVNARRSFRGTWYGFDLRTEEAGALSLDGEGGRGERFLAESHRLPGFDHDALRIALVQRQSDVVCFHR